MTNKDSEPELPVTRERLTECIDSARFWASEEALLHFANSMQNRADLFAITSALLASVTSLSVWTVLSGSPTWIAQLVVAVVALVSAATAVVPRVRKYGEAAGKARELATQYGGLLGELTDAQAVVEQPKWEGVVRHIVDRFQSVKARKDQLAPYPHNEKEKREMEKREKGPVQGKAQTADAAE
jgi:hypothetical protein